MSDAAAADRYARALFELGEESGSLAMLTDHIGRFAAELSGSKELRDVVNDPTLEEAQREAIVAAVASRLSLSAQAVNALKLLARRHRLGSVGAIAKRLALFSDEKRGVLRVVVRSAKPLTDDYASRLSNEISAATGKTVLLEKHVDPELIAGVVTQIGDNTIDGTLRGRLHNYEQTLLGAG